MNVLNFNCAANVTYTYTATVLETVNSYKNRLDYYVF